MGIHFHPHWQGASDVLGHPVEIWHDSFLPVGPESFVLVKDILHPLVFT